MKKYAVEFSPDQTVEAIAADRDEGLLIFDRREDQMAICEVLERQDIDFEEFEVWTLPDSANVSSNFDSCGFTTAAGRHYVFAELVRMFTLVPGTGEPEPALAQLCEHVIASFDQNGQPCHIISAHIAELAERIAAAYRCQLKWVRL